MRIKEQSNETHPSTRAPNIAGGTTLYLSDILSAMANPLRQQILELIADEAARSDGDLSIAEIATRLQMSRFAASHHLHRLRDAGLLDSAQRGARITHRLNVSAIDAVEDWIIKLIG